jgi:sigma-E factor negative regulatory protein RseA
MTMDKIPDTQKLSSLMDGQLPDEDFADLLERIDADEGLVRDWHCYHVIGDVLRNPALAPGMHSANSLQGLRARLSQELPLAVKQSDAVDASNLIAAHAQPSSVQREFDDEKKAVQTAANDAVWHWKLVAGLAGVAAVMVTVWSLVQVNSHDEGARMASVPPAVPAATVDEPVMIRDPRLDELLAAHKQFGGTSALQNPSGFLRNATFEGAAR